MPFAYAGGFFVWIEIFISLIIWLLFVVIYLIYSLIFILIPWIYMPIYWKELKYILIFSSFV